MGIKVIAKNKRAHFDYQLEDKLEAGIVLVGTEVKSLRNGKVSIAESHITIDGNGEVWAFNIKIPQYEFGNINNHVEDRKRKLLLNAKEITKLFHKMKAQNLTIVPTMIYFKGSNVKLEIALGRGKKLHDKRADEQKKTVQRKLQKGIYE
ncbi:SsrA-binding protein [Halobacteriovorax marinus SJ]|uniref:SsrA-binding protein n=1 Tax=Halobacteriovorax marinus (strain ATCC BAA-682 / DSM 15412 / SJ) TaxID=862908 RepID=E1X5Q8_HALMS|nr:SsrA-binding protein SmpB [Halobacteriovorax marinus]CBW25625.1 SsrA-binding protein [Halobacteriovorax marinus SJ]